MAVLKLKSAPARKSHWREKSMRVVGKKRPAKVMAVERDYNGLSSSEWKAALLKDVEDRFGPLPSDLVPVGSAGW